MSWTPPQTVVPAGTYIVDVDGQGRPVCRVTQNSMPAYVVDYSQGGARPAQMNWQEVRDGHGNRCWRNTQSGQIVYSNPR